MKIKNIITVFTLCVSVKAWVTMLQPITVSLCAVLTTLNFDLDLVSEIQPTSWNFWFTTTKKKEEKSEKDAKKDKEEGKEEFT